MPFRFSKRLAFLAIFLLFSACSSTPPKPAAPSHLKTGDYSYVKEYMTWYINNQMEETETVGLSIALIDNQHIVWQQGFGFADQEKKIKATPETLYRAGSISKLFTGMAAMKLAESGKMNIDKPLVTYLPEFSIKSRFADTATTMAGITPRTLMTHHSGLPGDWLDRMWSNTPLPFTEYVKLLKNETTAYPPNTILAYSNLGVSLLGHAIQNTSGQPYAQYIDQALLSPLGMNHSIFARALSGEHASKAYSEGKLEAELPLGSLPAGGLNTTVTDLSRLAMMVNNQGKMGNKRILSSASLQAMFTQQNKHVALDLDTKIGLSWFIDDSTLANQETVYGHDGATIAHRAEFWVAPTSKLGVVVLANTDDAPTHKIATELLQKAWQAKQGRPIAKAAPTTPAPLDTSTLAGTYSTLFGRVDIVKESEQHYKVMSNDETFTLTLDDKGQPTFKYHIFGLFPFRIRDMEKAHFATQQLEGYQLITATDKGIRAIVGIKVKPQNALPQAWKDRLGTYQPINPQESKMLYVDKMELKVDRGFLTILQTYSDETEGYILTVINDSEAILEGLGRGRRETIYITKNEKGDEILHYSGLLFKRSK